MADVLYLWQSEYPWDVRAEKSCRALTAAGHHVHLVARNRRRDALRETRPEATVHRMPPLRAATRWDDLLSTPAFLNPRWSRLVRRVVEREHIDVILVRDLPLAPLAIAVARRHGLPVVLDMAEHYPAVLQEIWNAGRHRPLDYLLRSPRAARVVERHALTRVDYVLTVAEESSERVASLGVPGDRIVIVGNTPPRARAARAREAAPDGAPLQLAYVGLLEIPRGITELLHAVALLRSEGFPVQLHLVGGGRDEAIFHAQAADLGLREPDVTFYGTLANDAAMAIVGRADVGMLPLHRNEHMDTTLPNKLFDYMSLGLAVATSDTPPSARVVRETGSGVVFRARDPASLAAAVRGLTPAESRRMGEAGRQAVLARYNWERDAEALAGVIVASAGSGRASHSL